jgi:radical SAM superfamily enzyme YgiQ (UPF0313 family)
MKILLIQPRAKEGMGFTKLSCFEPLGLECIAAAVEDEHDLKLIDLSKFAELSRPLSSFKPDICAISCSFAVDVARALGIAEFVKMSEGKPLVVIGGHHASLSPSDFDKEYVDVVVVGEGEVTFSELVACLSHNGDLSSIPGLVLNRDGGQTFTAPRNFVQNLDELPLAARHLSKHLRKQYYLSFEHPIALVETTRGCPYRCNFCSVHKFFGGRVRFKSAERVVQELATIKEKVLMFSDDNFLLDIPRAQKIASLIKENGIKKRYFIQARSDIIVQHPEIIPMWKEVGLDSVFMGFEKIDEEGLKYVNKKNTVENNERALHILRSHNVGIAAAFIIDPDDTAEDFARLRRYVQQLRIKTAQFSVLTPLPGTDLFTQVKERIVSKNCELFDGLHAVLPTKLSLSDFYEELSKLYAATSARSAAGYTGVFKAIERVRKGQMSLSQLNRITAAVKMLTDPKCYLAAHAEPGTIS